MSTKKEKAKECWKSFKSLMLETGLKDDPELQVAYREEINKKF